MTISFKQDWCSMNLTPVVFLYNEPLTSTWVVQLALWIWSINITSYEN